jgi:hypothetical protein
VQRVNPFDLERHIPVAFDHDQRTSRIDSLFKSYPLGRHLPMHPPRTADDAASLITSDLANIS